MKVITRKLEATSRTIVFSDFQRGTFAKRRFRVASFRADRIFFDPRRVSKKGSTG